MSDEIIRLGQQMAAYIARANAAKSREARDNWRAKADGIWGELEGLAVTLFGLTDDERADFNTMVGLGFRPEEAINDILEARDSADYNSTISAVLWGGY